VVTRERDYVVIYRTTGVALWRGDKLGELLQLAALRAEGIAAEDVG
jgi:hypothetical protein